MNSVITAVIRSRLNRDLSGNFGSSSYAREELVALSGQSAPVLH